MDSEKLFKLIDRYAKTKNWGHSKLGNILLTTAIIAESNGRDVLDEVRKACASLQSALLDFEADWLRINGE